MRLPMHIRFVNFLVVIPLGTLVGARDTRQSARPSKTYTLGDWYQGQSFLSEWSFFNDPDPTGGNVDYLDMQDALDNGLVYVDDNNAIVLQVDSWSDVPPGGNRNSVRITSNKSYNGGLFILDATHMPYGCSVWPSFWTTGPNWPYAGEMDIVEGVDTQTRNQMTLHSGISESCTIDPNSKFTGHDVNTQCLSSQTSDAGCSIIDSDTRSFGAGFNDNDGGVFTMLWDNQLGVLMWFFPRSDIPADITYQQPTPSDWPEPSGFWSAATCNFADSFYDHSMIIDTTICGGWAGSAYPNSGCPGTCSQMVSNASNFAEARWVINYIAVYTSD